MEVRPHLTTDLQEEEQTKYLYSFKGNYGDRNGHTDQQKKKMRLN
jgi:hypothetical protein